MAAEEPRKPKKLWAMCTDLLHTSRLFFSKASSTAGAAEKMARDGMAAWELAKTLKEGVAAFFRAAFGSPEPGTA
ncbi:hypothetical protein ACWCPT_29485 [Streptomyces sp. NPDC002308]